MIFFPGSVTNLPSFDKQPSPTCLYPRLSTASRITVECSRCRILPLTCKHLLRQAEAKILVCREYVCKICIRDMILKKIGHIKSLHQGLLGLAHLVIGLRIYIYILHNIVIWDMQILSAWEAMSCSCHQSLNLGLC